MNLPVALRAELDRYVEALEARFGPDLLSVVLSGHALLRDRGGFFASVLDRLRARLRELGSRR